MTWLAARRSLCTVSLGVELDDEEHVRRHLTAGERERFRAVLRDAGEDPDDYTVIPVHPLAVGSTTSCRGMLPDVLRRDLVLLGEGDHLWRAQQSLRTFLDVTNRTGTTPRPRSACTALGFLRGGVSRTCARCPRISDWLHAITEEVTSSSASAASGRRGSTPRRATPGRAPPQRGAPDHTKQLAALWRESRCPCWPRTSTPRAWPGCCTRTVPGVRGGVWIERSGASPEVVARCWTCTSCRWPNLPLSQDTAMMPHSDNVTRGCATASPWGRLEDLGEEVAGVSNRPLPEGIERIGPSPIPRSVNSRSTRSC
ncbi:IucA/IucC family protein [Kocuria rhizophila]|nr:IucA/IucC family protein [Kocuria rhizophila]